MERKRKGLPYNPVPVRCADADGTPVDDTIRLFARVQERIGGHQKEKKARRQAEIG